MDSLFHALRQLGKQAEQNMLNATGGVNTHKGIIFSGGLLCGATGNCLALHDKIDVEVILGMCATMAHVSLDDFNTTNLHTTSGLNIMSMYSISGVRGEASAGFPNVQMHALPLLTNLIDEGCSFNDASVIALLSLLSTVDDTNIISRASLETLRGIQAEVKAVLQNLYDKRTLIEYAKCLDRYFIANNISAGGCADLLVVTWYLYLLGKM